MTNLRVKTEELASYLHVSTITTATTTTNHTACTSASVHLGTHPIPAVKTLTSVRQIPAYMEPVEMELTCTLVIVILGSQESAVMSTLTSVPRHPVTTELLAMTSLTDLLALASQASQAFFVTSTLMNVSLIRVKITDLVLIK